MTIKPERPPAPDSALGRRLGAGAPPSRPAAMGQAHAPAPAAPAPPGTGPQAAARPPAQAALLAALLQLEQRARGCADEQALAFLMVNETHALAPYRQAVLWHGDAEGGDGRIAALSGLAVPERHAPFNVWLARLLARHAAAPAARAPGPLPRPGASQPDDAAMWAEHLPANAWWLPLPLQGQAPRRGGERQAEGPAGLLLLREAPWTSAETAVLALAADAYAHAWRALRGPRAAGRAGWSGLARGLPRAKRRRWIAALGVALLALLALPVRQSVLAPAEVVARAPEAVRAPLQGVVDRIEVRPNQPVAAGQLLATLDARELQAKLESARQALAVAEAEWRQGQQQALFDERSKATLALLQGKRDQAAADADYYAQSLARTQLRAERAGIALFDDPADWVGKPVALGERIMLIADPRDAELEVQLPVSDAIALPADARARLFLNAAPASPIAATVLRVGYRAAPTADGTLAYRVRARFDHAPAPGGALRVGLKGTAKLYGERTVLAVYLLRRPLATLRVWLGL